MALTILSAVSLVFNVVTTIIFYPSVVETKELLEEVSFSDEMLVLVEEGKLDEVIAQCNERERGRPNDLYVYYYRGLAHYYKGEKLKALPDFQRVIELDPSWTEVVTVYMTTSED